MASPSLILLYLVLFILITYHSHSATYLKTIPHNVISLPPASAVEVIESELNNVKNDQNLPLIPKLRWAFYDIKLHWCKVIKTPPILQKTNFSHDFSTYV